MIKDIEEYRLHWLLTTLETIYKMRKIVYILNNESKLSIGNETGMIGYIMERELL